MMSTQNMTSRQQSAVDALNASDSSVRLQAALALGTHPDPGCLEAIVERCAVEPDFYVRDMLTWALIRLPAQVTLPRLRRELDSDASQARSQALHTLSKIGDKTTWPWITSGMLCDPDDDVARTAWRAAVVLVPDADKPSLFLELAHQFGRSDRSVQLSLSRSLIDLGDVIVPILERATKSPDPAVAIHALATGLLLKNPETGFDAALHEARHMMQMGPEPTEPVVAQAETGESAEASVIREC